MTSQRRQALRILLVLGLFRVGYGDSETALNTCLFQSELLNPGEQHNLTIPCQNPQAATFQDSDGNLTHQPISPSNCASTSEKSVPLSLIIDRTTPEGKLNLTISCQYLGPLCFSYTVAPPGQNPTYPSGNKISHSCDSQIKNGTSAKNSSLSYHPGTQGKPGAVTTGSQATPISLDGNGHVGTSGMTSVPQRQPSQGGGGEGEGEGAQNSPGADTTRQGPSAAQADNQGQPTQGVGAGNPSQSPQAQTASTVVPANTQIQPTTGAGARSQDPQETGGAQAVNAQTPCTCGT